MPQNPTSNTDPSTRTSNSDGGSSNQAASALKQGLVAGAHDLSTEVRDIAGDVASEAKKTAESKLGAGKDFAAEHLGSMASALRSTSMHLRADQSGLTEYVEKAATSVEQVSNYLQTRTLSQLMGDAEGYARREPAVFFGGAFVLGLLGGRFLKSATPSPRASGRVGASAMQPWQQQPSYASGGAARSQSMQGLPQGSGANVARAAGPGAFGQDSSSAYRSEGSSGSSVGNMGSSGSSSSSAGSTGSSGSSTGSMGSSGSSTDRSGASSSSASGRDDGRTTEASKPAGSTAGSATTGGSKPSANGTGSSSEKT